MLKLEKPFVGEFAELLEDFIRQQRNLGYKYVTMRVKLRLFSLFTLNYKIENKVLSKQLVTD